MTPASAHPAEEPDSLVEAPELPARARALLAQGDTEGYGRLFARTEAISDHSRRYQANVRLIELGLAAIPGTRKRQIASLYAAVADGAVQALEREPREPKLLNYAGVALYELWSLDAAQALFEAAKRLEPTLGETQRNLAQTSHRRRSLGRSGQQTMPGVHPAADSLARRALAVAELAQPAEGLRMSLCMIVRDEEEMLPRCLAAVRDAVDEMVIVDTGSKDRTIAIAQSFGARVLEREWTGSFGEARNVAFDAASGDWTLVLDADELLVREDVGLLRSLTGRTWREAFYVAETNYTGDLEAGSSVAHNTLRVFRNRPQYRYRGRLHEQIADTLPGYLPERLEYTNVRIEHYGYLGAVRDAREKSRRNIELLQMQQQEGESSPFLHYNLGAEYAVAGEPAKALAELQRAWELLQDDADRDTYQFAPALANRYVRALRACGRFKEAIAITQEALVRFPGFTDLVLEQAAAHLENGDTELAIEGYERCIAMGDAPRRYTATVGCGSYLPRIALGELRVARGEVQEGVSLLGECLREHPEFVGSVLPYASAMLMAGAKPELIVAEVQERIPDPPAMARFLLGTALYEGGATQAGEEQFRAVLARQPHSSRTRVALGETLLAQRRYAEAAEVVREIPTEDQLAVMGSRSELFACIAGDERIKAGAALARAQGAGMGSAETDLFTAWYELAGSGETAIELAHEAVGLLGTILEALLRVHDFTAFEVAVKLVERTPLPARERREQLAELYLRRGFLASAAEEWMAICAETPDARALFGLARVAERQGMAADAVQFAQAALLQEPGHEAAARLLGRVQAIAIDGPDEPRGATGESHGETEEPRSDTGTGESHAEPSTDALHAQANGADASVERRAAA
jgi:glycosyltransferase involved in cell wall biosynthesis